MKIKNLLKQIIGFSIVGLSNTIVSYIVYFIVIFFDKDLYLLGNTLGFIVVTFNAYFWNNKKVFSKNEAESQTNKKAKLIKTYLSYGFSLCLSNALLHIFVQYLSVDEKIAPFLILFITYPINYLLNKFWIYKNKTTKEKEIERI